MRNRVLRLTESGGLATGRTVILDGIPGGSNHDGGRIKFGPDGKLYVTAGDAGSGQLAQSLSSLAGKILRTNADGSVPSDNPFPGSPVYSYGHRNPQGLAWDRATGTLYATEHGPSGDDEVNIIRAGANYGWPTVSGRAGDARFVDPIAAYSPSVAPSGAAFAGSDGVPCWRGSLFFATLRGTHLRRLAMADGTPGRIDAEERLLDRSFGRLREVAVGPDGALYVFTNNRDGCGASTAGDDKLLRLSVQCR